MAAAFGFSVSDFITSINLVKDIIKAQYNNTIDIGQRSAPRQVVQDCESTIDDFLASLQKCHGHLGHAGSTSKWKDAVRKIQWHLCKADDLTKFRLRIASHVQNIEMLLGTIQA